MHKCITCGAELHPERAKKYDYCMSRECQEKNAKGLTMVAVGVNKAAEQYLILDEQTKEELASGKYHDQRRGSFGTSGTAPAPPARSGSTARGCPASGRPAGPAPAPDNPARGEQAGPAALEREAAAARPALQRARAPARGDRPETGPEHLRGDPDHPDLTKPRQALTPDAPPSTAALTARASAARSGISTTVTPGGAQHARPSPGGEQRRLQPGDHHPAQARLDDEFRARARPGGAGGARLQRAVERRPGQPRVRRVQLGQRGLFRVVVRAPLPRVARGQHRAVVRHHDARRPRRRSATAGTAATARSPRRSQRRSASLAPARPGALGSPPVTPRPWVSPSRRAPSSPLARCPSPSPSRYLSRTMSSRRRTSARRIGRPGPCGYTAGPANRGAAAAPTKNGATASSSSSTSPSARNCRLSRAPPSTSRRCTPRWARSVRTAASPPGGGMAMTCARSFSLICRLATSGAGQ